MSLTARIAVYSAQFATLSLYRRHDSYRTLFLLYGTKLLKNMNYNRKIETPSTELIQQASEEFNPPEQSTWLEVHLPGR